MNTMLRQAIGRRPRDRARTAGALLVVASLVAGCSSSSSLFGSSSSSSGSDALSDRLGNFFAGPTSSAAGGDPAAMGFECPNVGVREGASTLSVNAPGETSALNLRYQATIARTARECAVLGATLTIKVGMQGRVILGPNGGPGQLDVPIRYAVVREGPDAKTLASKLHRIKVDIPPGQTNVPFTHVEEDLTIALPSTSEIDALVIYVGFDPTGAAEQDKKRKPQVKPTPRPTPKPKTAAQRVQ
jgi:hypothetical protein